MLNKIFLYLISFVVVIAVAVLFILLIASFERHFGSLVTLIVLGICLLVFFTFFLTPYRRWFGASREARTSPITFVIAFASSTIIVITTAMAIRIARQTDERVFWAMLAILVILSYFSVRQDEMSSRRRR